MTFNMALLIQADADGARAEVTAVGDAAKKTTGAVKGMGSASQTTSTQTKGLGSSADQAEARIKGLTAAERQSAAAAKAMGQSHRVAAGQTANLVAQGNDVMVMMMAGQNPLQLAMQQGTQISQVIGPMGAAGAFKSLGGAVLGMLNPISLVTIGSIAAGAAMVNWLRDAKVETRSLDDILSSVSKNIDNLNAAVANADVKNVESLRKNYGQISIALLEMLEVQREMAQLRAFDDLSGMQSALRELTGEVFHALNALDAGGHNERNAFKSLARDFDLTREEALKLRDVVDAAANAEGPTAQADAYKQMRLAISDVVRRSGELTDEQEDLVNKLLAAEDAARRLSAIDMATNISSAANQASRIADELARAVDNAISLANQGVGAADRARINFEFKDDPIGRAEALAMAEFDSKTQLPVGTDQNVVDKVNDERREFVAARVEAAGYTEKLRDWQAAQNAANRKSAGGAGAAINATKQQRKAVTDLITGLQDEIAILNASDPVQKEMLRNRQAMIGATDAERQTIGDLIAQRNKDTETLESQKEVWTELRSTSYGFFEDMRSSGGDLEQVFANLADRIADMVFQAALLGEGPLAGMFGLGSGTGGGLLDTVLGAVFPSLAPANPNGIPAHADGGMIYGKGGPRDDQVLMYGSNGEFMMNAKATAKHRHLLEALNSGGSLPGFANGGAIGGGSASSIAPQINIMPMNNSSVPLQMEVQEDTGPRGQKQQKLVISDTVATGLSGGAAKKVMRDQFGARQRGIGRG